MQYQEVEYIDKSQGIALDEFDNVKGIFGGYIATYETKDLQGDIIKKGAFAEDIQKFYDKEKTISVFHEHNPYIVLSADPIEITNTNKGVYGLFQVADQAKEIHKKTWEELPNLFKNGELGFSVGIKKALTTKLDGGRYVIHKGIMNEFSTTKNPANLQAKADIMKNLQDIDDIIKSVNSFQRAEEFLRKNTDFSQRQCREFIDKVQAFSIEKAMKKNLSPVEDCQSNESVEIQKSNEALFWGEVAKQLKQK